MKRIGIAGAGGIGSNVADNLIRMGFNDLKIVDFDRVEKSNLNRQFYFEDQVGQKKVEALKKNLKRINSKANLITNPSQITDNSINTIFEDCPIVVEGFDQKKYKKIFLENLAQSKELSVSASGVAGNNINNIKVKKVGQCHIVGDFTSDVQNKKLFASKVRYVAAKMSNIILKKGIFHV